MKKILITFVAVDFLIINLFVFGFVYQNYLNKKLSQEKQVQTENGTIEETPCPQSCLSYLNQSVDRFRVTADDQDINENIVIYQPTPAVTVSPVIPAKTKVKSTSYLPIPGSGNTLNTTWTDLQGTDFYLSTADYPGLIGVYFEANIKLQNGNGLGYVRIYDFTNSRAVDGSELSTSSQTSVYVSGGPINLWSGFNHYKVQLKSLTADTTYFESGRLKIISEN